MNPSGSLAVELVVSVQILNPRTSIGPAGDPVALSQDLLREARRVRGAEQCARLDEFSGALRSADMARIDGNVARTAFWLNIYNALLLHCLCLRPLRGSILRHLRMFGKVAYDIDGRVFSLNLIEHGLLRGNRRPPLSVRQPLAESDPRRGAAPSRPDPRIHFALNCGARSCPPVRVYDPAGLDDQLDAATRSYLQAETTLDPDRGSVTLPRLMRLYSADFGSRADQLRFTSRYLPELAARLADDSRLRVRYGRFDWTAAAGSSA